MFVDVVSKALAFIFKNSKLECPHYKMLEAIVESAISILTT